MDFGVSPLRPAVLAIDLHRGHLDMSVATMPTSPECAARVLAANARLMNWCRGAGIPVIHMLTCYRDVAEIRSNAYFNLAARKPSDTRRNAMIHNIKGGPGVQVMPEVLDSRDFIVDTKKRYDCFLATDLDFLLRTHGINTLLITGVNTNSCVLAPTIAASVRDFAAIVVEDCVDTMDTPDLHTAALACIRTAFGSVLSTDAIIGGALGKESFHDTAE
jgi:nicotinamidase-related amidase